MEASIRTDGEAGTEVTRGSGRARPRRHPRGQLARLLARLLARGSKRCWCIRCTLARTGIYRRVREQDDGAIRIDVRVLGLLIRRQTVPLRG